MTGPEIIRTIGFKLKRAEKAFGKAPRRLELGLAEEAVLVKHLTGRDDLTLYRTAIYGMTVEVKNSNGIRVRA